jgi:hypothetical protein
VSDINSEFNSLTKCSLHRFINKKKPNGLPHSENNIRPIKTTTRHTTTSTLRLKAVLSFSDFNFFEIPFISPMGRREAKEHNIQALLCNTYCWQIITPVTGSTKQWVVCGSCLFRSQLQPKMNVRICCCCNCCCRYCFRHRRRRRRHCYWSLKLSLHRETYSRNVLANTAQFLCSITPGKLLSKSYTCLNI